MSTKDWIRWKLQNYFVTTTIGDITVKPITDNKIYTDKIEIRLKRSPLFGLGMHETTREFLKIIQDRHFRYESIEKVLDIGTGSGILAIACAKLGARVVAVDKETKYAKENCKLNSVESKVKFTNDINLHEKFDVILMNSDKSLQDLLPDWLPIIKNLMKKNSVFYFGGTPSKKREYFYGLLNIVFNIAFTHDTYNYSMFCCEVKR